MSKLIPVLGAAILVVVAVVGAPRAQSTSAESVCADCHDDIAASFHLTPHATERRDAPSCESCHGDGAQHIEEGDPALIMIPQGAEGARQCLSCHAGSHGAGTGFSTGDIHARSGVSCNECHLMHPESPPLPKLLADRKADATSLCVTCHRRQERTFSRPFGHRLGMAGIGCVSCHDPHGGAGARSLKVDRTGETVCVSCHSDLRGPYVFPHLSGAIGGCDSCHEPHGSSNPHALKRSRADQLCLECHSTITAGHLGSQPPSSHDLRTTRFSRCTVCHVAIHGSNTSPTFRK